MQEKTKNTLKKVGFEVAEILIKGLPNYILTNLDKNNNQETNRKGER